MNKKLFEKVKELCKDYGLSEKYLQAITQKMGGNVEEDSTDEKLINETANLIAEVAKESQGEASRWVNKSKTKKNQKPKPGDDDDDDEEDEPDDDDEEDEPKKKKGKKGGSNDSVSAEIKALRKELEELKTERSKGERAKSIAEAMEAHKIPKKFRERLAKSISDEEDIEEAVAAIKQDLITESLMTEKSEGSKAASEQQVKEAADSLLESITVKDKE